MKSYFIIRVCQPFFKVRKNYSHTWSKNCFKFSDEVSNGLFHNQPVVALESTVITHGLPYPENLRTALRLEEIVRQHKATPATIGVIEGKVHIGMTSSELESLAEKNKELIKISRRDLPFILSKKLSGGTTVAATMALAHRAGIPIFVTGGIGGVHRGAETSMDISADLYELSRTPMTVISAGVKSILDIGLTLEYLETLGVCVSTFGSSRAFPSFFTPKSKYFAPCNVENFLEAAKLIDSRDELRLESGLLIAVPIPEEFHKEGYQTEAVIEAALAQAKEQQVVGRDITPFVLNKVHELSNGASLKANIGLLENNARVGSQIAVQLSALRRQRAGTSSSYTVRMSPKRHPPSTSDRPVVIGGSNLDIHVTSFEDVQVDGRTLDGKVESTAGGVGRNLADCLTRLQTDPLFLSVVGAQEHADTLLDKMKHMDTSCIRIVPDARTATCMVFLDPRGECLFVIGDLSIHSRLTPELVKANEDLISTAPLVVIDGNISMQTMDCIFTICSRHKVPVWFEPTDLSKAFRPFKASAAWRSAVAYASPNINELRIMHNAVFGTNVAVSNVSGHLESVLDECVRLGVPLLGDQLHSLIVTLGAHGVLLLTHLPPDTPFPIKSEAISKDQVRMIHYPATIPDKIISVSGAGDCFAAGMVGGILRGLDQKSCIQAGQRAAYISLISHDTVPAAITPESVFNLIGAEQSSSTGIPIVKDVV